MTRKDYVLIADVFKAQQTVFVTGSVGWHAVRATAVRMAEELLTASKYDLNGNKSFKPDVFLAACGVK